MGKREKISRRAILGIMCILLSVLIAFVVFPFVVGLIGRTTEIVRVTETIRVGEQISESNIEKVNVSGYHLPLNSVRKEEEVLGKYVTAKLEKGDYVLKSKLVDNMVTSGNYMNALNGSKQIVSVTIKDFSNGISGKLMPGDVVQVFNNEKVENNRGISYPELQYIKVLAVTMPTGVDMGGETVTDKSELPATVTLLVSKAQAQLLSGLDKNGSIYFSLVYRGDEETVNQFLQKQDEVLISSGEI